MIDKPEPKKYVSPMGRYPIFTWWLGLALALALLGPAAVAGAGEVQEVNAGNGGETLDLKPFLAKGKTTLFDFYSPFCGPCLQLAPLLEQLAQKRPDLAIRKVNINRPEVKGIDWRSPLVQQYNLHSVPHFAIYDRKGKLETEGQTAFNQVMGWLREAGIHKDN